MAAAMVVAVVATLVGVREMSSIIGAWTDGYMKQTLGNVTTRIDDHRTSLYADAMLLAQDENLARALAAGGSSGRLDTRGVAVFFGRVERATRHDAVMLLDPQSGKAIVTAGSLGVSPGAVVLSPAYTRWTSQGTGFTSSVAIGGKQTLTAFSAVGTRYTLAVSDIVDDHFLNTSLRGLAAAFAYFDSERHMVARYVDPSLSRESASEFRRLLGQNDPSVSSVLQPGKAFAAVTVGGERYRMLATHLVPTPAADPAGGSAYLLIVASTSLQEQIGGTTVALIAFWSVLAVGVLTAFGFVVARRVSAPLMTLSDSAKRIAEGDFTHKVEVSGTNEISGLAESFNQMTDSLRQRTESITKKVLELATLYEMSRALGSTLELDTLLDSVLDSALRIFNVESGYIVLRDRETEHLELAVWRGAAQGRPDERALRSSMCEWVSREGRPLIYNPPGDGETGSGQIDTITGSTAALCVPLVSSEGIIGAVTVGSREPDFRFTSDDVRLLSTIANHATIAVGNIELFSSLQDAYIATVRALAAAVDAKDPYTRGHSDRVAEYSMAIAAKLDLNAEQRTALEMAAYLHDIGKIGIREEILLKPGKLDDDQMAQMRHHPLIGANILRPVAFPWAIAPVVRHHHEHWDGKGYPAGLRGEEIPLLARILSVADSYEAMTSDRPYRHGRSAEEGITELKRCSGTQFDPRVVDAFVDVLKEEERDRAAIGAKAAEDVQPDEARAIFVALCDGMLASFRRLGGPRLSSNLEAECNRHFTSEGLAFAFESGRLTSGWDGVDRVSELDDMRRVVELVAGVMSRTSGSSLVDSFYLEALSGLSARMRALAETLQLYRAS
jgi:putative nucleotidyltransferase with HDIG domain